MKAAVYYGKRNLQVTEVPDKVIKENEVLIQVKYCGVCGTDVHIFQGEGGAMSVTPPLIPGHEFSGVVVKTGTAVKSIKIGDHVCVDPNDMCGECYFCRSGKPHFCERCIGIGTTVDGGFAEYAAVREKQVYKVKKDMDLLVAAMAEPLSCCIHGIDLCDIQSGATVLILGGGAIGILMMQLAKLEGAGCVIVSEPIAEKRAMALKLGADVVHDPMSKDIGLILPAISKNVDVVIECVGKIKLITEAFKYAGKCATVMLFGLAAPGESLPLEPDAIFKKELKVTASFINPYTFERAVKLLETNRIDVTGCIAEIIGLEEIRKVFTGEEYRRKGKVMIKVH